MKKAKKIAQGHMNDQCDGGVLMSRRAEYPVTVSCRELAPCPETPLPGRLATRRPEQHQAMVPKAEPEPEPEPAKTEEEGKAEGDQPEVVAAEIACAAAYARLQRAKAAAVGEEACGGDADCGKLYPELYFQVQQPVTSGKMPVAPQTVEIRVKKPEECVFADTMPRKIMWNWRFTMAETAVPTTMTVGLEPAAVNMLAVGREYLALKDDPTITAPWFIIPLEVTVLSTNNESPISYVAKLPWLPVQTLVLNNGQTGAFEIPPGAKSYSAREGRLYTLRVDAMHFLEKRTYLIGRKMASLMTDTEVPANAPTTVMIRSGSELDTLMAKYDPDAQGYYAKDAFDAKMRELDYDIGRVNRFVITPAAMSIDLEIERPAKAQWEGDPAQLLDIVLGGNASGLAKEYHMNKQNKVSVVLQVVYKVLV